MKLECSVCRESWDLDEEAAGTVCPKRGCDGVFKRIAPIRAKFVGDPYVDSQASDAYRQIMLYQDAMRRKRALLFCTSDALTWEELWFYGQP